MSNIVQRVLPLSWRAYLGGIPLVGRTWYYLTTIGKSPIRIVQNSGIVIEMPRSAGADYFGAMRTETYESETWKQIREALTKSTGVFLDVGANIGWYSLQVAQMGRRVIAIEPARDCLKCLRHNLELNPQLSDRVTVIPIAASDATSTAIFYPALVGMGGHSLLKMHRSYRNYYVATAPLDDVIHQPISVAKIDVEGNEPRVLAGMKRIINEYHPAMSIECLEKGLLAGNYTVEALLDILRGYGYTAYIEDSVVATAKSIREMYRRLKIPAVNLWCTQ